MRTGKRRAAAAVTLAIAMAVILLCGCSVQAGITGDEWLLKQQEYTADLEAFSDGMDEVYTLYTMGSISEGDFVNEIALLQEQYQAMELLYEKGKIENPVLPESYSYVAQRGVNGIEKVRELLGEILDRSIDQATGYPLSTEEIAYLYLSYREEINENLAAYLVAYQMVSEDGNTVLQEDQINE